MQAANVCARYGDWRRTTGKYTRYGQRTITSAVPLTTPDEATTAPGYTPALALAVTKPVASIVPASS
jgi:hypothetical protein